MQNQRFKSVEDLLNSIDPVLAKEVAAQVEVRNYERSLIAEEIFERLNQFPAKNAVLDLLKNISAPSNAVDRLEQRLESKKVLKKFMAIRTALNLSQSDVGPEISKVEQGTDADLSVEIVMQYLDSFLTVSR